MNKVCRWIGISNLRLITRLGRWVDKKLKECFMVFSKCNRLNKKNQS